MSELNMKRRASILKKRASTAEEDDPTEITVSKFPKKTQFSQKKQVKEFLPCEENVTIWGNTYETSVAKSEGSSDGSSTSRKISVDFSHTTINSTNLVVTSMIESEKENIVVEKLVVRPSDENSNISSNSSSAHNSVEMTIEMNASERRRVNKYGTDNLNITNMPLDASLVSNKLLNIGDTQSKKVLSPRKMIFINKKSNLSVTIKDKVFMDPSKLEDNVSVSLEEDEKIENINFTRKTLHQPVDMNISVEQPHQSQYKKINFGASTSRVESSLPKITPTLFKVPEMPKTFNFQPQCYDSPPIKPAALENQNEELDEMFEMMVSDTPSKNLCCLGKAHTPIRSSAQKVVFSAYRPTSLRKSTDIFKDIGLMDDDDNDKFKNARRTIFHNDSIKLDQNTAKEIRKTTFDKIQMDETTKLNHKTQHNDSDLDISTKIEENAGQTVVNTESTGNDKMDETCTNKSAIQQAQQKIFLDETDPSVDVQQMNYKPCEFYIKEKLSMKRSTLSNDTCNATNFIMEMTNIDDTGGSLETTAEIQRKTAKLLKNPHANLGSSSTINSPIPEDITENITLKDMSKIQKSLNLEPSSTISGLQKSSIYEKNRLTTFNENNMDISGIEPTTEIQRKTAKLLENPLADFGSSSTNNSPILQDITKNVALKDMSKIQKSYNLNPSPTISALQKSSVYGKNRLTTFNENNMDISGIEPTTEIQRKTAKSGSSSTINSPIPEDITENVALKDMSKIQKTLNLKPSSTISGLQKSSIYGKNRLTTFKENDMEISRVEPVSNDMDTTSKNLSCFDKAHTSIQSSAQNVVSSAYRTTSLRKSDDAKIKSVRRTIFDNDSIKLDQNAAKENRKTTFENIKMDETPELNRKTQHNDFIKLDQNAANRKTTFENIKMDVITELNRKTQYNDSDLDISGKTEENVGPKIANTEFTGNDRMDETCTNKSAIQQKIFLDETDPSIVVRDVQQISFKPCEFDFKEKLSMKRSTLGNDTCNATNFIMEMTNVDDVGESLETTEEIQRKTAKLLENPYSNVKLSTTHNLPIPEDITENITHISKIQKSLNLEPNPTTSGLQKSLVYGKNRVTTFNGNNMEISGIEPAFFVDPPSNDMSFEVKESPLHKKRATTYNRNNMDVSSDDIRRATTYKMNDMEVSGSEGSGSSRRKTFTITTKNESLRWHNITDADLDMIDDESNPCNDISGASPSTVSDPNNISRYEEALEDFMNLTVKESPLNQPMTAISNFKSRRQSRIPSPVRDYDTMFEDFMDSITNVDRPKPRLEIDEFLEKMKVEPIKIPRYEQCQEGYLQQKLNELLTDHKNRREERRRLKKEIDAAQFPQIPSAKFLMKNLIECMEEDILKEIKEKQNAIPPIFPEAIDFERLLINKFNTDEHLSKYWELDSLFWHKGHFKLMHKKMAMFTLNFSCQQYMCDADDSTIPILFRNVMLYLSPEYRNEFSTTKKNTLLRREFHRVINGVDNFTSVCNSTRDLFEFLGYYHSNVIKALDIVENFLKIVSKYKAVYTTHPRLNYDMIHKRIFQQDDIVNMEICIDCYLEEVPIGNLTIKGRNFNYVLDPNSHVNRLKGLMLIELVLFDTEKFLSANVHKIKLEDS